MAEVKAKKPETDAAPVSPKKAFINASDRELHLEAGIFQPGEDVIATVAEISTLCDFIKEK